ncbi:MAG: hypothetical protein ACJ72S_09275 [Nitrososphaeraceae archaeon]
MAQTLCIKCGSELKVSSYCQLCQQPLIFACTSCEYVTEEKVHPDCRNAEILAKPAKTISMPTFISTTANQQESIVDKIKQEKIDKVEISSSPSHMKSKEDNGKNNNNNNINPFAAGTVVWQSLMTYWLNAYGEFFKNALKTTEEWYNIFYKPWINWMPQRRSGKIDID